MTTNSTEPSVAAKMAQYTQDEEVVKRKLLFDGDGLGDERRIANLIRSWMAWGSNDNETPLESQLSAQRLLMLLDQLEWSMAKSALTTKIINDELCNCESIYKNIDDAILAAQAKCDLCKLELANARRVRCNKMEYDSIASAVDKHPSTQETQCKLGLLEKEIDSLQNVNTQIEQKLEKRRRQFQLLFYVSHQLQNMLDDEQDAETVSNASTPIPSTFHFNGKSLESKEEEREEGLLSPSSSPLNPMETN